MKKAILMILLFFFTTLSALAQYVAEASSRFEYSHMKKTYNIYFDTGVTHIDYSYRGNIDVLYGMKKDIELTLQQDNALPDSLLITATASPDGAVGYNTNLAEMRALETKRVLLLLFPDLAKSVIQIEHHEITWDGVAQIIAENKNIPEATEMLGIIASDLPENVKESALRRCKWGWKYIVDNHLYVLRNSTVTIRIVMKREVPVEIPEISEGGGK